MPSPRPPPAPPRAQASAPVPRRPLIAAVGAAVVFALLVVSAGAPGQVPDLPSLQQPDVRLTIQTTSQVVDRGECARFTVTVANTGEPAELAEMIGEEEITLSVSSPGSGWHSSVDTSRLSLERGDSAQVRVDLCAGDDVPRGDRGSALLTAVLEPAVPDPSNGDVTDSVRLNAEVEEAGLFGLPFDFPPWILWVVLAALGVMFVAVVLSRRSRGAGVEMECAEASKEVTPGRGTSFPVRIRNEGSGKDVVSLTTSPVPHGWDTFLPLVDVPLEAGDEQTVWISVKSPDEARDGDHVVVKVFARSSAIAGEQAVLDLTVTVRETFVAAPGRQGPGAGGEQAGGPRSVYEPEDPSGAPEGKKEQRERAVAVKRRKA